MATFQKRGRFWRAQIRKVGYPAQSHTFDTKAQAEAWARAVESEMDRGIFIDRSEAERTSLHIALERYATEILPNKRHPYQEQCRIRRWQATDLAKRPLASLRGADFAKFRDERLSEGRAENTVRLELALISHLFEIARKEWGMEGLPNPLKNIRKPSGSRERDRRLHEGEYDKVLAALRVCGNPLAAPIFQFAIETGLRQGMLFKLRWSWVDLEKRIIAVPKELRQVGNKGVPPAIPLSNLAADILSTIRRDWDQMVFQTPQSLVEAAWERSQASLGANDLRWGDQPLSATATRPILDALRRNGDSLAATVIEFSIETGLSKGFLFKLRWSWVDLDNRLINIPAAPRGRRTQLVPATIGLSMRAVQLLTATPLSSDALVFQTTQNAIVMAWKRVRESHGITDLRWHDLRHEAASRLFEKGLNPMEVAAITGHKNLNMLRRYTHLSAEALAKKLD